MKANVGDIVDLKNIKDNTFDVVFVNGAIDFMQNAVYLHGDKYFYRLSAYFKKMDNFNMLPRNPKTVLASVGENLQHPAFAGLHDKHEFQELVNRKELKG